MNKLKEVTNNILQDKKIMNVYEETNSKHNFVIDHGGLHINHVLKYINEICEIFKIDEKIKHLSFIAGFLHDIGYIEGRDVHVTASAKFAEEYLVGKLNSKDREIVVDAIAHHDRSHFDYNSKNPVAYILFMADKMNYTRDRYIEHLVDDDAKSKYSYYIKKISLERNTNLVIVTFETYDNDLPDFHDKINSLFKVYTTVANHFNCETKLEIINLKK